MYSNFMMQPKKKDLGDHTLFTYTVAPSTSISSSFVTAGGNTCDFQITPMQGYYLQDENSMVLQVTLVNNDANPITPVFAEMFLDKNAAVEILQDGRSLATFSSLQALLRLAQNMPNPQYKQVCSALNHDVALSPTSPTAIPAGATRTYLIPLPNLFPKQGFWLGGFSGKLTIRIRINQAGIIHALGAGANAANLQLSGSNGLLLLMNTVTVGNHEIPGFEKIWSKKAWHANELALCESNSSYSMVSNGPSPFLKLESLAQRHVSSLYVLYHASRSLTNGAYFTLISPSSQSSIVIVDRSGRQVFTSAGESNIYSRTFKSVRQLGSSELLLNTNMTLIPITPDMSNMNLHGTHEDDQEFVMSGDESISTTNFGNTTSAFIDVLAWCQTVWQIEGGQLTKISG